MDLKRRFGSGLGTVVRAFARGLDKVLRAIVATLTEALKLAREMLVIPAQLWLLVAEVLGGAVLRVWRNLVVPALRLAWGLLVALYRACLRQVTPRRAVAAVGLFAAAALIASQWLDYRSVSVGTPAYQGEVDLVAPAPDVVRDPAGDAHAWVMIPIALLGAAGIVLAYAGRPRGAWLTVAAGLGAIAIAAGIDAPKGLDEGAAKVSYEGADAQLLEGFWAQIACGAALAAVGILTLLHGRSAPGWAGQRAGPRERPGRRAARREGPTRLDTGTEGSGA
jgi:hypothetical protein